MTNQNKLTFVPLKQLVPPSDNPRKIFDDVYIESLAQSIKANGVLQNLVVVPLKGKKNKYEIISGECRYRALNRLVELGDIKKDYSVPVSIREGIDAVDAKRMAVVENLLRKDMHPMDEAHAVVSLIHDGDSLEDISAQTGLGVDLIKKRIVLTSLCDEAQDALRAGTITLSQGQALTLGTHDRQKQLLEDGIGCYSAEDIADDLTDKKIALSSAIFLTEKYTGAITRDLFFNEDESYFDDRELFFELQDEAVENLRLEKEAEGFTPVEICKDSRFRKYEYREAEEGEQSGCVIHYAPNGDVTVHDGLINRKLDEKVVDEIRETKPKPTYSNPLLENIAMHKSIAVQNALLSNPRKAKEVAVVLMLNAQNVHSCYRYFDRVELKPKALEQINQFARPLLNSSGFDLEDEDAVTAIKDVDYVSAPDKYDYEAIKQLTDKELDQLHLFLTTIQFGQEVVGLDTDEDSFFNLVANDLSVDMRDYWMPDKFFLSRLKADKLEEVIAETQTSHLFGTVGGFKRKDLVSILVKHFEKLSKQDVCDVKDIDAKNWLPEVMDFPAIDPDIKVDDELEAEGEADLSDVA